MSVDTNDLHRWLERMRQGDRTAEDELLRAVGGRLEVLARCMLAQTGRLRQLEQTGDVLQQATMRLLRSLQKTLPETMRDFYALAAAEIRRELIDLARQHFGRKGNRPQMVTGQPALPETCAVEDENLDRWTAFHEAVESLNGTEREVISLAFYHGLPKGEMAAVFGVDARTIRRWWQSACLDLRERLNGRLPDDPESTS